MLRGREVPGRLRTLVLVLVLLALHLFAREQVEAVRLMVQRLAARPLALVGLTGSRRLAPFTAEESSWLASSRVAFRHGAMARRAGAHVLPVLDLDMRRQRLLLGGGRALGVRRDALVFRGDGCLGVVDRVAEHLSRVRLLAAPRTSLPITVADLKRPLPGGLRVLHGVLKGDGKGAYVASAFLPESFQKGDRVVTLEDEGQAPRLVGVVEKPGTRPRVRLATLPDGVSLLEVQDVQRSSEAAELFDEHPFQLLYRARGCYLGAVIVGPDAGELLPGSAVSRAGWFLGVVVSTGAGVASVNPSNHPGQSLTVLILTRDRKAYPARLRGDLAHGVRLERWLAATPAPGEVLAVTAGGQQLVPPWLVVGRGQWRSGRLQLKLPDGWPKQVQVSVFRHASERQTLMGRGR